MALYDTQTLLGDVVPDIQLTQAEADALLALEKHCIDATAYDYPALGGAIRIPRTSPDKRESFVKDVTRRQIDLKKGSKLTLGQMADAVIYVGASTVAARAPQ